MTRTDLDVVYVNYHTSEFVLESVATLRRASSALGLSVGIVVVDNSEDPSAATALRTAGGDVDVVVAGTNLGFAAGCNLGASRGRAPHLFFLNPDTRVSEATLAGVVEALESRMGRAIVGPRQRFDAAGVLTIAPLTGTSLLQEAANTTFARGWSSRRSLRLLSERVRLLDAHGPVPVRALSGGALAIGRVLFNELGGWDEGYFFTVEDTDLCVRAARRRAPVLYLPHVPVVHYGAGSRRHAWELAAAGERAGRMRFRAQHHPPWERGAARVIEWAARHLPRRGDRWQAAVPTDLREELRLPGRCRGVVEFARSPLFDNGLIAFAEGLFRLPSELLPRLPGEGCFVRTAVEDPPGRWRETLLGSWVPPRHPTNRGAA